MLSVPKSEKAIILKQKIIIYNSVNYFKKEILNEQ